MTMHCREAELLLTEFAAGELDCAAADRVARHLAGCDACRAEADRELQLREMLGELPVLAVPTGLAAAVPSPGNRRFRQSALGGLVAAAITMAVLWPTADSRNQDLWRESMKTYTPAEVTAARRDALLGLALAARIIERTELDTVADVFGRRLPRAVTGSLGNYLTTPQGGRG